MCCSVGSAAAGGPTWPRGYGIVVSHETVAKVADVVVEDVLRLTVLPGR